MKTFEEAWEQIEIDRMRAAALEDLNRREQDRIRILAEYRQKARQEQIADIPCTGIRINNTVWAAGKSQEPAEIFSLKPVTDKDQRGKLAEVCTHISVNGTTIF